MQIDFSAAFDRVNHQGILIGSAHWRFCDVFMGTFSVKPITTRIGGWLSQ